MNIRNLFLFKYCQLKIWRGAKATEWNILLPRKLTLGEPFVPDCRSVSKQLMRLFKQTCPPVALPSYWLPTSGHSKPCLIFFSLSFFLIVFILRSYS